MQLPLHHYDIVSGRSGAATSRTRSEWMRSETSCMLTFVSSSQVTSVEAEKVTPAELADTASAAPCVIALC